MIRSLSLMLCFALAACAGVPQSGPAPRPLPVPQPDTSPVAETAAIDAVANGVDPGIAARAAVERFVRVAQTVEPIAEAECRARAPQSNCDFRIVIDDTPRAPPNAFQTLDRQGQPIIAFTIPLIAEVRNSDEMAFILAHEAAHHIRGHLAKQRQNANVGAVIFGQVAGAIGGANADAIQAAQQFGAALGARTYSKDFELEADELGTIITAKAGFNPVRGADFFFRIPDPGDRFLGTHPANAERVAIVRTTAARFGF